MIGGPGDVPFYEKIWWMMMMTHPFAVRRFSIHFRQ